MNATHVALALGTLAALPEAAHAQVVVPSGKIPAQQPGTAQLCVACHGQQGEGGGTPHAPRIAGQPAQYLEKQLHSYANGSRRNPAMEALAKAMSPQDMHTLAVHYSQLVAPAPKAAGPEAAIERGRVLATKGDPVGRVQACANCHGPGGVGQPPAMPYLAGLHPDYLAATINAWKEGTRNNDAGQQMATAVAGLTVADVAAVSHYYASLPPPRPVPTDIVTAPVVPAAPRLGAGPAPPDKSPPLVNLPVRAGEPARGRALIAGGAYGCTACHAIPGIRGAVGIVGPSLGGFAARSFLAGQFPNNAEVLGAFLLNPAALVPHTGMPNVGLNDQEARDIAAFLLTLEP